MKNQITDMVLQVLKKNLSPRRRASSAVRSVTGTAARTAKLHLSKLCKSASGLSSFSAVRGLLSDMYALVRRERGLRQAAAQWKLASQDIGASPIDTYKSLFWMAVLLNRGEGLKLNTGFSEHLLFSYYVAWQHYLDGSYPDAVKLLKKIISRYPDHLASRFLLSDAYYATGDTGHARENLRGLEREAQTWPRLASYTGGELDFDQLEKLYLDAEQDGELGDAAAVALESLTEAALRAGNPARALELAQRMREQGVHPVHEHDIISTRFAEDALQALAGICTSLELQPFLISRTLLSYIRDGSLSPQDASIRLGLMEGFDRGSLLRRLSRSGVFMIKPHRSPHCISLRHVSGTSLELYTHCSGEGDCWYGGPVVTWHFTPFELRPIRLLEVSLAIPNPPQRYLEEHYGAGYATTLAFFDEVLESPNARTCSEEELEIYRIIRGQVAE